MAIHDKDKRREILTGRVVNPDENKDNGFIKEQNIGNVNQSHNKIEGNTISGAGSATETGDTGGDFDRPGTNGDPSVNDYVKRDLGRDTVSSNVTGQENREDNPLNQDIEIPPNLRVTDPASGFPGKGSICSSEDKS
ncbi:MAG TPA: hypothetical protein VD908_19230 [Cytophagales bacterium]|nr:hypothetical protein [Cytophagales bacterium]